MSDFNRQFYEFSPEELRPTAREWLKHTAWFLVTFLTTTIAGLIQMPFGFGGVNVVDTFRAPANVLEWLLIFPFLWTQLAQAVSEQVGRNPILLVNALTFSGCLLAILTAHEFGHYIAARLYGVKTSLPYFIPTPPFIGPSGTLGAVIRIQSPMPSPKAIFDIGVAGPLAGFAVIIPVAILGLLTMEIAPPLPPPPPGMVYDLTTYADPLLTRLLGALFGIDPTRGVMNSFYGAAWMGCLVTSLNLLPVSQLDGGHTVFAVLGERAHFIIGRVTFAAMILLTIAGFQLYGMSSSLLFVILLAVLLRLPHPQPLYDDPIDNKRKIIAVITLVVLVLTFMPFPIFFG